MFDAILQNVNDGCKCNHELFTAFSFKKYCSSLVIVVKMLIFVHSDAEAPP